MLFFPEKCPVCTTKGLKVENETVILHIKDIGKMMDGGYSFCQNPKCDVVYFRGEERFVTTDLNKEVGLKESSSQISAVCYCYNYLKSELYDESLVDKINIRIENYGSKCYLRNPSGRCCLKSIKKKQQEKKDDELHDIFKKK